MAGNSPVALPCVFTVSSLVVAGYAWGNTPSSVPIWWSVYANPVAWVPRWFGLLVLPVLGFVIPYIMYLVVSRDKKLDIQSGESANAIANIIALPALLLFTVFTLVYVQAATSDSHVFRPEIFTANVAVWALFWLGYNLQFVEPNSSIGVPYFHRTLRKDLWSHTHLRAGRGLMLAGVILFIFGLACPIGTAYFAVTLVLWIGAYVLVLIDSYTLARLYVEPSTPNETGDGAPNETEDGTAIETEDGTLSTPFIAART